MFKLFLSKELFHLVLVHNLFFESICPRLGTANSLDHFCPVLCFSSSFLVFRLDRGFCLLCHDVLVDQFMLSVIGYQ